MVLLNKNVAFTAKAVGGLRPLPVRRGVRASAEPQPPVATDGVERKKTELPQGEFCLIETSTSMQDFDDLELSEVVESIQSRRNKIFLLMEEVRRLRIQQRVREGDTTIPTESFTQENFKSALPFLPPVNERTLADYYRAFAVSVATIIVFGGLIAPLLEVRLGLNGQSYADFIRSVHLPAQLADVDPIVASFCGGAVGVLSALLLVEVNNIKEHEKERCFYCLGSGYLACGTCVGSGKPLLAADGVMSSMRPRCMPCSGTGKVMCCSCLATGKQLASEHDPRLDPWA